jgi:pimeloyl-ACP methyl ester carboxylesterase
MHRLRSHSTGISYLSNEAENASLVVCLHGFPDIPRTWAPLTEELRDAGYHVVSPWLPGYAPSSLEGPFDSLAVARMILALIDELSPSEPVRIVGHDWGSIIAQCAIAQSPSRFRAAALLSVPHMLAVEENFKEYPMQIGRSAYVGLFQLPILSDWILKLRDFAYVERLWRKWSPGFDPGEDYFDELKLCLRSSMPAPLTYYRSLASPKVVMEMRRLLASGPIVVPTIYLHGENCGCVGAEITRGQEAHFSALFEQVMLADAGHFVHLERPTEVNAAITEWFKAH